MEKLLDDKEVAVLYRMSVASIRRKRLMDDGPRYYKLNGSIRYKLEDVIAWLESRPTGGCK
jgi:hypothetical protein